MQFHNSTPQTVGDHFAKQEARRASKGRSPHGSDMEPCAKKQKFLHASMPPGLTQFQARPTPYLRPVTDKGPKSVDASLPPVPTPSQTPATTNLGPSISTSKRKKYDHRSNTPAQSHDMANHGPGTKKLELDRNSGSVAQSHDITDLGPAHKKQRLSFASLPPGRGRVTLSVEERERKEAELNRCVHKRWCKSYEPNPDLTNESILPDAMLLSGKFNDYEYMSSHSSNNHGHASGPQEAATYPFDGSSAANPRSQSPKVGAYCGPRQELQHLFHHSPAPNRYPQALSVSGEVSIHHSSTQGPISRDCSHVTAVLSPALGGKVNEACPNLINQASTMLSSLNSSLEGPSCTASIPNAKHTTTSASADQTVLVGSVCDMADETVAASSDSSTPSSLAVTSRETVPSASSSQTALINSIRDTRDDGADMSSNQIPLSSSDVKLKGDITSTSSDFISLVDSIRHAGDKTANVSSDQIGFSLDVNLGDNTTPTGSDQTTVIDSSHDTGDKIANASSDQIAPPSLDFSLRENTTPTISDHMNVIESTRDAGDVTVDASLDEVVPSSLDVSLRDGTTPASTSETPSVGPARSKGGRPRGRKPRELKPPKGRTRFQKNHPVKATVNMDVWENILLFCPLDFLLRARSISKTFRSVLKHDSLIWKKARVNQFGPEMPDPPLGLSEPQYADLVTGNGCHTRGCTSKKARKTYWALGKRLCIECFQKSFIPPRALKRVFKEFEKSATPQYNSIARYYQRMDEFLPSMRFDRWDNYQWLGEYNPAPSWGHLYRSGQYAAYPAAAYANLSSELAVLVGNEYDVEYGRFSSNGPLPGKTCASQDVIDAWFEAKRAANLALMPELQAAENWCELLKRDNQKASKDFRKNRKSFYEEQADLAGWNKEALQHFKSYQAAIAISKPPTLQSWKILKPKIVAECETEKKSLAEEAASNNEKMK